MIKLTAKVTAKFYAGTIAGRATTTGLWSNVVCETLHVLPNNVHIDWVPVVEVPGPHPIDLIIETSREDLDKITTGQFQTLWERLKEPVMGGHQAEVGLSFA